MAKGGYNWTNFLVSLKKERELLVEKFTAWEVFIEEQISSENIKTGGSSLALIKGVALNRWNDKKQPLPSNDEKLISELQMEFKEQWGKTKLERTFVYLAMKFPDKWICKSHPDPGKRRGIKTLQPRIIEKSATAQSKKELTMEDFPELKILDGLKNQ